MWTIDKSSMRHTYFATLSDFFTENSSHAKSLELPEDK